MTMIDCFVPPGVQVRLHQTLGTIPRQCSARTAAKIAALWMRRNQCAESEIEAIDAKMLRHMIAAYRATITHRVRIILEEHNLHGSGSRRHRVFVLPVKCATDYWRNVTDVPCPACRAGTVRWHEAGYVPGYRICDACKRTFLASGDCRLPKLILD